MGFMGGGFQSPFTNINAFQNPNVRGPRSQGSPFGNQDQMFNLFNSLFQNIPTGGFGSTMPMNEGRVMSPPQRAEMPTAGFSPVSQLPQIGTGGGPSNMFNFGGPQMTRTPSMFGFKIGQ